MMPQFISKLQHDTYERGEFTDEKVRSLEETIKLIREFPWDSERSLTDIQLTCPSVTIEDENLNYLKVGIFFNGKYCLYYLDSHNHLYEYPTADMNEVINLVTLFFNQQLSLEKFDKHLFNIGNQAHFVTSSFEYYVSFFRVFRLTIFIDLYFLMFLFLFVGLSQKSTQFILPGLFLLLIIVFIGGILGFIFYKAYVSRNMYFQISKGNDIFSFGYNEEDIRTYNKKDVARIVAYEHRGSRNPNMVEAFEIVFKNDECIKLSNFIISGSTLYLKFSDKMDNVTVPIIQGKKNLFKML